MNTQVLALLIAGVMGMGAMAVAALSITILAALAWRGTGGQQAMSTVRVDSGHIQMGPFLFARVELTSAGRWVRSMRGKYDTLWQDTGENSVFFLLVEKKRAPVLAMA